MDWLTAYKIPIGAWAKVIFDWMKANLGWLFDAISVVLEGLIAGILWLLQAPPALVVIAVFLALT
jgi:glycine betaine/proline transport system permease protein